MPAGGRQQEQREADCEQQEHGFGGRHPEIDHLDVDVPVVVVAAVVMVLERALHGAVEALEIEMRMDAAQLRPDQGYAGEE
jgi:hypothetical protein